MFDIDEEKDHKGKSFRVILLEEYT